LQVVVDVTNPMGSDYAKLTKVPWSPASFTSMDVEIVLEDSATGCCNEQDAAKAGGLDQKMPSSKTKSFAVAQQPLSAASWLSAVLPASATVVKTFNNLSAYALLHGDPLTEVMKSVAASDNRAAAEAVAALGRTMGLEVSRQLLQQDTVRQQIRLWCSQSRSLSLVSAC
jgi:hypothetical protein